MISPEWRCNWSSADRRFSNYIWVIDNVIAYKGASYIRGFTVGHFGVVASRSARGISGDDVRFRLCVRLWRLPNGRFVLDGHLDERQLLAVRLWRLVYPMESLYWMKDIQVRGNDWLSGYEDSLPSGKFVLEEGHFRESQWLAVKLWRQCTQRQVCTRWRTSWWEPMIGCQVMKTVYPAAGLYWLRDILVRANDCMSGCEDSLPSGRFVLEEGHPGESQWLAVRLWRQSTQRQVCTGRRTSWWEPMIGCQVLKTVYPAAGLY